MKIDIDFLKGIFKNLKPGVVKIFSGVVFDSRTIMKNSIFFALKGRKTDGHKYIEEAIKNGAACVVVSENVSIPQNITVIKVRNTYDALIKLAACIRNFFSPKFSIAVAGSNGKTTVKEMIYEILSRRFNTFKTPGNMNSRVGLSTSFINAHKKKYDAYVFEVGATEAGDITALSKITKHNIAVLTGIGYEHLETFKSIENVRRAEFEVIKTCSTDKYVTHEAIGLKKGYTFGEENATIKLLYYTKSYPIRYKFEFFGRSYSGQLQMIGRHNIFNALCAILTSNICGFDVGEAAFILKDFKPVEGRGRIYSYSINIYDDSYNSNPTSLVTSIKAFFEFFEGKNIIIIGDMLELGKYSEHFHRRIGSFLNKFDAYMAVFIGKYMKHAFKSYRGNKLYFTDTLQAVDNIKKFFFKGANYFLKASRLLSFEKIRDALLHISS